MLCHVIQTDVVDDIPTVKFVYVQWVGNDVKPLSKAKISTHKGALEEMFYVSLCMNEMVTGLTLFTHTTRSCIRSHFFTQFFLFQRCPQIRSVNFHYKHCTRLTSITEPSSRPGTNSCLLMNCILI